MPSKKILVVLILCVAILASVAIWQWRTNIKIFGQNNSPTLTSDDSATKANNPNAQNWQGMLSGVQGTTSVASGLINTDASSPNESTNMTDLLSQDFFGRYMLIQGQENQSGIDTSNGLDTNISNQIADDVLSSGNYTSTQTIVYTPKNLNIQPNSNQTIVQNYFGILQKNASMMLGGNKQSGDEIDIINNAILNQNQNEIIKLDPIITSYKTLLSNMLKAPIPKDVTNLHLEFVNSISNILYDLQAIRGAFDDPVKALPAINSYKQDYMNMGLSVQKLMTYVQIKAKDFKN